MENNRNTHKTLNLGNYILIVDDSEIKDGDWMHRNDEQPTFVTPNFWWDFKDKYRKIIAHLPLNNSPILEGVSLLPSLEDNVENVAEYSSELQEGTYTIQHKVTYKHGFIDGHNKAKDKYKYTEEDMRKAMRLAREGLNDFTWDSFDNIIQSISQPKMPIGFKCEMEKIVIGHDGYQNIFGDTIKTTTNSQGQTVWVGKWT